MKKLKLLGKTKAFTLIELLATIIILAIIGLIVYPTVNKLIIENKQKAYEKQINEIERLASNWVSLNEDKLSYVDNHSYYLELDEMYDTGFISEDVVYNPKTGDRMEGCVVITWIEAEGRHKINYDESCSTTEEPEIAIYFEENVTNANGWAKEDFNAYVEGKYLDSYSYCISNSECVPDKKVVANTGTIIINDEGQKQVCVFGENNVGKTDTVCKSYKLDLTGPVLGDIVVTGTKGLEEWYVSNVTVSSTNSSDALSGLASEVLSPAEREIKVDTSGITYTLTATDLAGNTSSKTHTIKVDKTPPTAGTATFSGTKGSNDWYISNVTVNVVDGSDGMSGHKSTTASMNSITTNVASQKITITTTDNAGNTSTRDYTVKVDKGSPTIKGKTGNTALKTHNHPSSEFFDITYSTSGGTVSYNPANTKTLDVGTHTISCTVTGGNGKTATASTQILIDPNYSCKSGETMVKDASKGYVCTKSATEDRYNCNCTNYECNCQNVKCNCKDVSCNCKTTTYDCNPTKYKCGENHVACGTTKTCVDYQYWSGSCRRYQTTTKYCDLPVYCTKYLTCEKTTCSTCQSCDTCQSCSTCTACDTCTRYLCPSGMSDYSGSGSNKVCYRNADLISG